MTRPDTHTQGARPGPAASEASPERPARPVDRNTLVREHRYLVKWLMTQLATELPRCADWDDLWAAGLCELVEASRRYDPSTGVSFADYAHKRVRCAILVTARFWIEEEARRSQLGSGAETGVADVSAAADLSPDAVQRRLLERHEAGIRLATVAGMSGSGSETLTATMRRLAEARATGQLSVETPWDDVVLEFADGTPVGIGPAPGAADRMGPAAGSALATAAVVDELVDRTVAAIVGDGGDWTWDVDSGTETMPLAPEVASELTRRAADAARAMTELGAHAVLRPGPGPELGGKLGGIRELFDGERTLQDVAELTGLGVPTTRTLAAALVRVGALSTAGEDPGPTSWIDTVARCASAEAEEDEPEPWGMEDPDSGEALEGGTRDAAPGTPATDAEDRPAPPPPALVTRSSAAPSRIQGSGAAPDAVPTPPPPPDGVTDPDDEVWHEAWNGAPQETSSRPESNGDAAGRPADDELIETDDRDHGATHGTGPALYLISELPTDLDEVQVLAGPSTTPAAAEQEPERAHRAETHAEPVRRRPMASPDEVSEFFRELSELGLD